LWVQLVTWSITRATGWNIDLVPTRPTSRRAFLVSVGTIGTAALVASCGSDSPTPVALESDPAAPGDVHVASELELIALYSAITQAFPDLAGPLTPIADQHREHARALGYRADAPLGALQIPPTSRQALRQLIDAEERAARDRQEGCAVEPEPERVRLLALIAASEATHVLELTVLSEIS